MTPAEVIAEMRERVGTSNYVVPVASVERWADELEAAMREKDAEIERLKNLWFNDADPRETEYAKEYKDLLIARSNGDPRILDLYGGDPNCKHELDHHEMNGVRCLKCGAWFCY